MDRRQGLLADKPKKPNTNRNNMSFLTEFNRNYRSLEKNVRKHFPILLRDKTLVDFLPKQPTFVYRRAPILRNEISLNVYNPPKRISTLLDSSIFFHCKRCKACRMTKIGKFFTGRQYNIDNCISCDSTFVTYLISCPCGLQYVGRMTSKLGVRINEHLNNIKIEFPKHSLSNHFRIHHNQDLSLPSFCGIDRMVPHCRGG